MNRARHTGLALVVLACVILACKKRSFYVAPIATASDAGADAAVVSGSCAWMIDKPRCQPDGKAAFCEYVHHGRFSSSHWTTFTCPSCAVSSFGDRIECEWRVEGEPCDPVGTNWACTEDKTARLSCDYSTHTMKATPCPGGCGGSRDLPSCL